MFGISFQAYDLFVKRNRYHLSWRILHFIFLLILRKLNLFDFDFCFGYFLWSNCMLIGLFYSSMRLRVENVSFTTHFHLGKKYAYRKRMVKNISNLHCSYRKNVNVFDPKILAPPVNCQPSHWRKDS